MLVSVCCCCCCCSDLQVQPCLLLPACSLPAQAAPRPTCGDDGEARGGHARMLCNQLQHQTVASLQRGWVVVCVGWVGWGGGGMKRWISIRGRGSRSVDPAPSTRSQSPGCNTGTQWDECDDTGVAALGRQSLLCQPTVQHSTAKAPTHLQLHFTEHALGFAALHIVLCSQGCGGEFGGHDAGTAGARMLPPRCAAAQLAAHPSREETQQ